MHELLAEICKNNVSLYCGISWYKATIMFK